MKKSAPLLAGFLFGISVPALSATVTTNVPITVTAGLKITYTPTQPTVPCAASPGSVVATLGTTGGDSNPVTFSGSTVDFTVSGTNIIVGPNGISAATCAAPMPIQFPVTATQQ